MATSKAPDVIDALVTICTNAATIGGATPPVAVYDGPKLTKSSDKLILWIGLDDPDSEGLASSAETTQNFPGLGTRQRNEDGFIYCVAEAWSGGTDVKTGRDQAFGIVHALETLLRADASIGGAITAVAGWAEIDGIQLRQGQADTGFVARVAFHIKYRARI